jgi:hypothetical protein
MSFGAISSHHTTLTSSPSLISWKKVHFVRLDALQDGATTNDYLEWPCYLFDNLKELLTTVLPRDSISFWTGIEPPESSHPLTLSPQDFRHELFLNMAHSLWIEECLAQVEDADGSKKSPEYPIAYLFADLPPACDCFYVVKPELESQLVPFIPHVKRVVSSNPSCVPAIRQVMQVFQQAACPWLPPTPAAAAAAVGTGSLAKHVRYALVPRSPAASLSIQPRAGATNNASAAPFVAPATNDASAGDLTLPPAEDEEMKPPAVATAGAATSSKQGVAPLAEAVVATNSSLPSEEPATTLPTVTGAEPAPTAGNDAGPLKTATSIPPPACPPVAKVTPDAKSKKRGRPPAAAAAKRTRSCTNASQNTDSDSLDLQDSLRSVPQSA